MPKKNITSLRGTIEFLKELDEILVTDVEVNPELEVAAVQKHLDTVIGKEEWKVTTRLPFNASLGFGERVNSRVHKDAVELQFNSIGNEVKKHQINNI